MNEPSGIDNPGKGNPLDGFQEMALKRELQDAYAVPPLREEFTDALSHRLDKAYRESYPVNQVELAESSEILASTPKSSAPTPQQRKLRRQLYLATGLAASLLLAFITLATRDSYSWAAMLEAIREQQWVEANSEEPTSIGDGESRFWFSSRRRVAAQKSIRGTMFHDFVERSASNYSAERRVVTVNSLSRSADWDVQSQLLLAVLPGQQQASQTDSANTSRANNFQVISEDWKPVDNEGGKQQIALNVKLQQREPPHETLRLNFRCDPETHLPMSCEVVTRSKAESSDSRDLAEFRRPQRHQVNFSYPNSGPQTIYALGVPEDAQILAEDLSDQSKNAAGVSGKSEPRIARLDKPAPRKEQEDTLIVEQETTLARRPKASPIEPSALRFVVPKNPQFAFDTLALGEPLAEIEVTEQLDAALEQLWLDQGITPAEPTSDEEFLRRVYLDLTGRIPTIAEVREFEEWQKSGDNSGYREQLVESLLARRDHATHLAAVWRKLLLPDGVDLSRYGGPAELEGWLSDHFAQNLAYDELARKLLLAEGRIDDSGPLLFYAAHKLNPEELAAKTSRVFLGTRMECAQCHDHPFDEISQAQFWGFAALFAQISRPKGKIEMVSPVMQVKDSNRGEVTLPDTETVVPPYLPDGTLVVRKGKDAPSRREHLVAWLTDQQNPRFARATVNRLWAHLFGRGLVDPVDDLRADNPAVSEEVLRLLSEDFRRSGYDLRRLLRVIVASRAYQLSSRSPAVAANAAGDETVADDPARALTFAQMNLKSFTAEQLYDCIAIATGYESTANTQTQDGSLLRIGNTSRDQFLAQFSAPAGKTTDYQAGIPQALTLMHGGLTNQATAPETSGLLRSLSAPFFDDQQRIEALFLATLSRKPTPQEQETMTKLLEGVEATADRQRKLGDILWALLNSAEFTFNH